MTTAYANYIGPSVMTDANPEGFLICDERITENDRCVMKIIGIHCDQILYLTRSDVLNNLALCLSNGGPLTIS